MKLLSPDLYYASVHAIDLDVLAAAGVSALLVDLDNTLLPRDTNIVSDDAKAWAAAVAERGFRLCLVSNNWHDRVKTVADGLGCALVDKALKPLPFAFRKALRILGARPNEAAVIGDQLFTDILGGSLVGVARTVLVMPLSRSDLPHTLALRLMEGRILADRQPLA
ncbi:MAG: YqeG family HAD IIIA-type phosphatase [Coriobacteriia bacterium]